MLKYPLKFTPLFKYRMWGGNKLKTVLNKDYQEDSIGESWEVSDVKGDETVVFNGGLKGKTLKELIQEYKGDFVGHSVYDAFGDEFPLLIKFIDAKTPLSIQVHPSNEIAKERHNSFGKNEMWYIMQADENAEIIVGFDTEIDKEAYKNHLKNNSILEVMHHESVNEGDTYYIPTGRIHAIGAGVLLAEIQQTSDITYRVYDYDRVDVKTGEKRELHNDLALDVIDFQSHENYKTTYEIEDNKSSKLEHTPYFKSNILEIKDTMSLNYAEVDSFVIYICVKGALTIVCNQEKFTLQKGETMLFPTGMQEVKLITEDARILEVYM